MRYGPVKYDDQGVCQLLIEDALREEDVNAKTQEWYLFVKVVLIEALARLPKSRKLHMLYAYIQHERLKNKFKALHELMIAETHKPGLQEEFAIYRYRNIIEDEMIDSDIRGSEAKGLDLNIIITYQNKFIDFVNNIEKAVNFHLDFWRELLEENPDIEKLQNLGSRLTHQVDISSENFQKLVQINPNNVRTMQIYGNFLREIINDDHQGKVLLDKAESIEKNANIARKFADEERLKYSDNSSTCLITVSANINELGLVTNCTSEIKRILQFSTNELIGQNISKIMPKILGDSHDEFIQAYFENPISRVMGIERLLFPINKAGFIVPCTLFIKFLPNLSDGIKLVGFLHDVNLGGDGDENSEEHTHYIIYNADNNLICGITAGCKSRFGIPTSLVYGNSKENNELSMEEIFPDLSAQSMEELRSFTGVLITLDTTKLPQEYMLHDEHSGKESEYSDPEADLDEKESLERGKYRRLRVRASIVLEEKYLGGLCLRVLKFSEVLDVDIKKEKSRMKEEMEEYKDTGKREIMIESSAQYHAHEDESQKEEKDVSDRASHVSASSMNEEFRVFKEAKIAISEKNVPNSIQCLRRIVLLLLVFVIAISCNYLITYPHISIITNT